MLEQKKADKIVIFKKKRRKNYRRTKGHRQQVTVIRIGEILSKGQKSAIEKATSAADAPAENAPAKKSPAKNKVKAKAKAKAKAPAKAKTKSAAKKAPAKDKSDE